MRRSLRRAWCSARSPGQRTSALIPPALSARRPSPATTAWRRSPSSTPNIKSASKRQTRWTLTTSSSRLSSCLRALKTCVHTTRKSSAMSSSTSIRTQTSFSISSHPCSRADMRTSALSVTTISPSTSSAARRSRTSSPLKSSTAARRSSALSRTTAPPR